MEPRPSALRACLNHWTTRHDPQAWFFKLEPSLSPYIVIFCNYSGSTGFHPIAHKLNGAVWGPFTPSTTPEHKKKAEFRGQDGTDKNTVQPSIITQRHLAPPPLWGHRILALLPLWTCLRNKAQVTPVWQAYLKAFHRIWWRDKNSPQFGL